MTWETARKLINISTHAPAGGATACRAGDDKRETISTHAPAGGATAIASARCQLVSLFLLTPLREGRRNRGC